MRCVRSRFVSQLDLTFAALHPVSAYFAPEGTANLLNSRGPRLMMPYPEGT